MTTRLQIIYSDNTKRNLWILKKVFFTPSRCLCVFINMTPFRRCLYSYRTASYAGNVISSQSAENILQLNWKMQHNAVLFRINLSIISSLRDPCVRKLFCMFLSSTLMFVLLGRWCQSYCWCWCKCVRCNNALSNYVLLDNIK